jgi:hypothetical protein
MIEVPAFVLVVECPVVLEDLGIVDKIEIMNWINQQSLYEIQLHEKYKQNFDVSSESPSSEIYWLLIKRLEVD